MMMKKRLKRDKKGQAAMEFLMTYGWAILAAIIAIGVLAYYGVFSPGKYISGTAIVSAPFYANAWSTSAAAVTLELKNNGGEAYNITSTTITNCGTNSNAYIVNASALQAIIVTCSPALKSGDTFKGDITVNYRKSGSTVTLASTGTVTDKVA